MTRSFLFAALLTTTATADPLLTEYLTMADSREWVCRTDAECLAEEAAKARGEECRIIPSADGDIFKC